MLKGTINTSSNITGNIAGNKNLDHNILINRDVSASHPIEAIDGLSEIIAKLKQDIKALTKQLYSLDSSAIKTEQERAMVAEESLNQRIKQITSVITTLDSGIDSRYHEVSKAIIEEALSRARTDTSLRTEIALIKDTLNENSTQLDTYVNGADNSLQELRDSLKTNNKAFTDHLEDFETQILKINNLISSFNKHVSEYKTFIRNNTSSNAEILSLISDLDIQLNEKISEQILNERATAEQELKALEDLLEIRLSTITKNLDTTVNRVANNNINYLDSKIEILELALDSLNTKVDNDINSLSVSLNSDINLLENVVNTWTSTVQTILTNYQEADLQLDTRINELNALVLDLAEMLKVQVETLNSKINNIQTESAAFYETFSDYRIEVAQKLADLELNFDDKLSEIDQRFIKKATNLETKIIEETQARKSAIASLEDVYKNYDLETLETAKAYTNDFASRLTADYTERDATLSEEYKEADKEVLKKTQKLLAEELKVYIEKLNALELWKSNISNVLDFVGITSTDITDDYNKKNSVVLIGSSFYEAAKGDVILYKDKEYVWTGGGENTSGWEEIGIGSANEAAIAVLQQLVGKNEEIPTGLFKLLADLRLYTDDRFDNELEKAYNALSSLEVDLTSKLNEKIIDVFNTLEEEKETLIKNLETTLTAYQNTLQVAVDDIKVLKQKDQNIDARVSLVETEFSQVKTEFDRALASVTSYWKKPESLIFNTRADADNYILTNKANVFPGQLITLNSEGILETYMIDPLFNLQLLSAGGSGGGSPDKITDTQYCIQAIGNFIPSSFEHFTQVQEDNYILINIPNPNRKNNSIITANIENPGGYIYYLSKLDGLKFTSGGFDAGVIKLDWQIKDLPDYFVYRTNQKLIDSVTITIN